MSSSSGRPAPPSHPLHEAALRRALLENFDEALYAIDMEGNVLLCNEKGRQDLGFGATPDRMERILDRVTRFREDQVTPFPFEEDPVGRALRGESADPVSMYCLTPAHPEGRWYLVSAFPLRDERGEQIGVAMRTTDITETRRAQEQLRRRDAQVHTLIRAIPDMIFRVRRDGLLIDFVPSSAMHPYVPPEEFLGRRIPEVLPDPAARRLMRWIGRAFESNETFRTEYELPYDDEMRQYEARIGRIQEDEAYVIVRDVSLERGADEKLRRQQAELAHRTRLSLLGEMASAMAHELNQPLSAIALYAKGCLRRLRDGSPPSEMEEALDALSQEALRAGKIIRSLRNFSRKDAGVLADVNPSELVRAACGIWMVECLIGRGQMKKDLREDLPPVRVDAVQMQQVLLNLLRNAWESMESLPAEERLLQAGSRLDDEGQVELWVRDRGPGISSDVEPHIFEPFYTTKRVGTGLGLPMSKTIVESHGGRLWHRPALEGGTVFCVTLPPSPSGRLHDA